MSQCMMVALFLMLMLHLMRPRRIQVLGSVRLPVTVYSDASFQQDFHELPAQERVHPRLGWVIFHHNAGPRPLGRTESLPEAALSMFTPRATQIFACEAIAIPEAVMNDAEALAGRDITWFIDNEPACSSFIRGCSKCEDVSEVVAIGLLQLQKLNCRVWFEWIDSEANPSDGLSREGLQDRWTQEQDWHLEEVLWEYPKQERCGSLKDWRWQVVKTLGGAGNYA